jgi:hypothetical protein
MRRRETYNFAAEEEQKINASELDSAVATANLISIMDPKEIGDDEVKLISEATGASEAFVDEMADVCDDACKECEAGKPAEEVKQHFSAAAEELIGKYIESKNFSAPEAEKETPAEEKVLQIAQLTTLVDDELLKDKPEEVAEVITEATEAPADAVKEIVEKAKEAFSNSNVFEVTQDEVANFALGFTAMKEGIKAGWKKAAGWTGQKAAKVLKKDASKMAQEDIEKLGKKVLLTTGATTVAVPATVAGVKAVKKNFSEGEDIADAEAATETIVPEPTTIAAEGAAKDGVSDKQPAEGTAQDPVKAAEMDPKEGDKVQDTAAAEAALKVQNDLATVESVADVPATETNFGRQNDLTGKEVTAGLKSLLGAHYIPNK